MFGNKPINQFEKVELYLNWQALTFYKCNNVVVGNLKIQNAQQMHLSFQGSQNVQVFNLTVASPAHSPNTDGIHITNTQNIQITNSVIGTGMYIYIYVRAHAHTCSSSTFSCSYL